MNEQKSKNVAVWQRGLMAGVVTRAKAEEILRENPNYKWIDASESAITDGE